MKDFVGDDKSDQLVIGRPAQDEQRVVAAVPPHATTALYATPRHDEAPAMLYQAIGRKREKPNELLGYRPFVLKP